jgi:hypothetical protein
MSDVDPKTSHKKIIEFIPYKTMAMDLESILADLTRIYVNRNDQDMVELLTLSQAELFPIGSFDPEAERYEYVLKLAVPVKFHNHLRDNISKIQPQLLADITTVTAPYLHEIISEVFVVIKIEQDSGWRDAALDWIEDNAGKDAKKENGIVIIHAAQDESGIVKDMRAFFSAKNLRAQCLALASAKDKDVHHAIVEFEKAACAGVLVVSRALSTMPFSQDSLDRLVGLVLNPGKRCCQVWDKIERTEVANFNSALARSLAFTTERMSTDRLGGLLMKVANLG